MRTIGCWPMTAQRRSVIFIFPILLVRREFACACASAPGAIPGILVVPLVGRLPDAGDVRLQVLRDHLIDNIVDAEARLVWNMDEAVLDEGLREAGDDVIPPRHIDRVILERHEVL